jgi:NAD(P)-dependent dehydrogenase (short-subunit alcohol dehydrogenase family)
MKLNKCILITGASSGIGRAACEHFIHTGYQVIGISRKKLELDDKNFIHIKCDISNMKEIENLKTHPNLNNCIDTLINCAGITIPNEGLQSVQDFQDTININLVGLYGMILNFLPNLKKSNYGSIINVASIGGMTGFGNNPSYGASKAAVINLSQSLAVDFAPFNIRVNSVSPGYFKTKMTETSFSNQKLKKIRENNTIFGRFGDTQELMGTFEFLASKNSSYMTGQNIVIDGGWLAKGMIQC